MKRLIKSKHGIQNRSSAILYIDGEIFEGKNHPDLITDYLNEHDGLDKFVEEWMDKNNSGNYSKEEIKKMIENSKEFKELPFEIYKAMREYERQEGEINNSNLPMAFAHKKGNDIFLETNSLHDVSKDAVVNSLKEKFTGCNIYDDDSINEYDDDVDDYKKIAKKRLKTSKHGIENRDDAILYINGEVLEGQNHPNLVTEYLEENQDYEKFIKYWCNENDPNHEKYSEDDIENLISNTYMDGILPNEIGRCMTEYNRQNNNSESFDLPMAFAHKSGNNIFLETNSLNKVDKNTVVAAIKNEYPNYNIYDDDSVNEYNDDLQDYKKIANRKENIHVKNILHSR